LEKYGIDIIRHFPKSVKQIKGDIYELRPGKNRVLYFYQDRKNRFILLHGFTKKTDKTPKSEVDKAIEEKKDFIRRYENE
jgi:phage-related protein